MRIALSVEEAAVIARTLLALPLLGSCERLRTSPATELPWPSPCPGVAPWNSPEVCKGLGAMEKCRRIKILRCGIGEQKNLVLLHFVGKYRQVPT
jgi:hypothetical protein